MSYEDWTNLEWLTYHVAAADAAGEDERDKGEREIGGGKTTTRLSDWWCCMPNWQQYIPHDNNLDIYRCENIKSLVNSHLRQVLFYALVEFLKCGC